MSSAVSHKRSQNYFEQEAIEYPNKGIDIYEFPFDEYQPTKLDILSMPRHVVSDTHPECMQSMVSSYASLETKRGLKYTKMKRRDKYDLIRINHEINKSSKIFNSIATSPRVDLGFYRDSFENMKNSVFKKTQSQEELNMWPTVFNRPQPRGLEHMTIKVIDEERHLRKRNEEPLIISNPDNQINENFSPLSSKSVSMWLHQMDHSLREFELILSD